MDREKQDVMRKASIEAVNHLGLIKPEFTHKIINLLEGYGTVHPKDVCAKYRKYGDQLSKEEKINIGINVRAFISREALSEITEKGLSNAIDAHYLTLLRATFTMFRYNNKMGIDELFCHVNEKSVTLYYSASGDCCNYCKEMDEVHITCIDDYILPNEKCTCVTANYTIGHKVDWFWDLVNN